jgi:hypothetical protein
VLVQYKTSATATKRIKEQRRRRRRRRGEQEEEDERKEEILEGLQITEYCLMFMAA